MLTNTNLFGADFCSTKLKEEKRTNKWGGLNYNFKNVCAFGSKPISSKNVQNDAQSFRMGKHRVILIPVLNIYYYFKYKLLFI
jgi:hypothetical protein